MGQPHSITIIKNSVCSNHVRVSKFIRYFKEKNFKLSIWSWRRCVNEASPNQQEEHLLNGGGYGGLNLLIFYPTWFIIILFRVLFTKHTSKKLYFVIDFDSALPVWIASLFKSNVVYIYDIHDDFELRYKFPKLIAFLVREIDYLIKKHAALVIHVDDNRVRPRDKKFIIIRNVPAEYKGPRLPKQTKKTFAVIGLIAKTRGIESITKFAIENPHFRFVLAGDLIDDFAQTFASLINVDYLGKLSQNDLFHKIGNTDFIFSLYNPNLEINRASASNKLYDAMMLGIPVIVNDGLYVSNWVRDSRIGIVVNFKYDFTWKQLLRDSNQFRVFGQNGRKLYTQKFSYHVNFVSKLNCFFNEYDFSE